jgi:Holliday junction resolvase
MSTAHVGRAFEYEIRNLFRDAGFSVVRGAGSKGEFCEEKVDLVASRLTRAKDQKVYLQVITAQCKNFGRKDQDNG